MSTSDRRMRLPSSSAAARADFASARLSESESRQLRLVIPANIRRARRTSGLTQLRLAGQSGASESQIKRLERAAPTAPLPRLETLFAIARATGASLESLLDDALPTGVRVREDRGTGAVGG